MQWTDDALVLRIGKFREADMWVRFLARDKGLVTAFAFGGSRSRRRFTGCLDAFNRSTGKASARLAQAGHGRQLRVFSGGHGRSAG